MKLLIHLIGTSCSGKSYISEEFKDEHNVFMWDILKWYENNGVLVNSKMNWDNWDETMRKAWESFIKAGSKALHSNSSKDIFILETSGQNQYFNEMIRKERIRPKVTVLLKHPTEAELTIRAAKRDNINSEDAIKFMRRTKRHQDSELTQYEAYIYIKELINSIT